ncbi:MAG TPA: sulfite exporter TauE/SafE family protein, partial [Tepidisphaeraceae bacterium]|nr:sulfite exporter TauE/SafE family protein [Tepidisphaeraceae bacterium]
TALIEIEVGIESVALVSLHWYRTWRGNFEQFADPGPAKSNAIGGIAGVSSTLAHAAGPIIALYLLPRKLDRRVFVGTCAIYFFMLNTAKLPAYWVSSQFSREVLLTSAKLLPLVFVGAAFGFWINRRMTDRIFSKVIYAFTFCLGFYLLYLGGGTLLSAYHAPPAGRAAASAYISSNRST